MIRLRFLMLILLLALLLPLAVCAETLYFPASLREIGEEAFMGDKSLDAVEIPDHLKRIEARAFAESSVSSISLPYSISYIAPDAFDGCAHVHGYGPEDTYASQYFYEHSLPYNVMWTSPPTGSRFIFKERSDGSLILTGYNGTDSVLTLPTHDDSGLPVTAIASYAFLNKKNLTDVTIPEGIVYIGSNAFYGCSNLVNLHIPESVEEIGSGILYYAGQPHIFAPEGSYAEIWAITYGFIDQHRAPDITDIVFTPQLITYSDYSTRPLIYLPWSFKIRAYGKSLDVELWCSSSPDGSDKFSVGSYGSYSSDPEITIHERNGNYKITGITAPDTYYLWIDASNEYLSTSYGPFAARVQNITDSVYVTLTGLVTERSGKPIPGVRVQPYMDDDCYTYTDSNGRWSFVHWNRQNISTILFSHTDYTFENVVAKCEPAGSSVQECKTAIGKPLSILSGSFSEKQISLAPGEARQAAGSVSLNSNEDYLGRLTLTIDGYDIAGDDSDRYATVDLSSKYASSASLSEYPELTLDAGKVPLNVPGTYTIKLWASLSGNDAGKMLDSMTVIVDNSQSESHSDDPRVISFSGPDDSISTGETAEFTLQTQNAESVTLIVDSVAYDTVNVTNNSAVVQRAFTAGGLRKIAFRANAAGKTSTVSDSMMLLVLSEDTLEAPQVTLSGSYNTSPMLYARWQAVPNAEQYVVYTYYEGASVKREVVNGSKLSHQLDSTVLTRPGNYGVEVIATAYGYSQSSGSALFTLASFDEYDAYPQQSIVTVYADAELSEPLTRISRGTALHVLYSDESASLVRFQQDGEPVKGFISPDQAAPANPPMETTLRCWYKHKNPEDPQSPLTITVWATRDMNSVEIIVDGQSISSNQGNIINSEPDMLCYLLPIPAVLQTSSYTINGYHNGVFVKDTEITIPPVQTSTPSTLASPKLSSIAPLPAGKAADLSWTGVTAATYYTVSLTRLGIPMAEPFTVPEPSCTLTADMLKYPGTYQMTVTAGNKTQTGEPASITFTVKENKTYRYLQAESYQILYSYNYLSFHDLIEVLSETASTYRLRVIHRTGSEAVLDDIPKNDVRLGSTQYTPDTPPTFINPRQPISLVGSNTAGGTRTIRVETNHAVEKADLYVDDVFQQSMTLQLETSYCAKWTCDWTVLNGEHKLTVKLTSANGLPEEASVQHTGWHKHTLKSTGAVINKNEITERGVAITSGTCSICGESMAGFFITPAEAYPGIISEGLVISGTLNNPNLIIHAGNGNITVLPSGSLTAASINCNQLSVLGNLHSNSINAEMLSVRGEGKLTMNTDDSASVRIFDFVASNNHSNLLTGGEMTISGNMSIQAPFQPGANHKTVFTSGEHLLQNTSSTRFGILVVYGRLGQLGAKNLFTYQYLVLPKSQPGQYSAPQKPQPPESCRPYLSSSGRSVSEARLTTDLTKSIYDDYAKNSNVKFKFNNPISVHSGTYFNVINTTPNSPVMPGSAAIGIVQQISLDALSDFSSQNQSFTLGMILTAGGINYTDNSSYDLYTGKDYRNIRYNAHVSGPGVGNSVSLGYLTVTYTEWDTANPDIRYSQTYQVTPSDSYGKKTIRQIMETANWQGKKMADQAVEDAKKEIMNEFASYMVELINYDKLQSGYRLIDTINTAAGMTQSDTQNLPLLKVYTDSGTMCVYSDQVTGNIPFSDLCGYSFSNISR